MSKYKHKCRNKILTNLAKVNKIKTNLFKNKTTKKIF